MTGQGMDCFNTISKMIILSSLLLMGSSVGQTEPPYCWNCNANDVSISDVWLGDASGNPLAPCEEGTVHAYIWARFENNQNSQRNGIVLYAKITADGNTIYDSFPNGECLLNNPYGPSCPDPRSCLAGSSETGSQFDKMLKDFTYTCGQEVLIKDIYIGWISQGTKCDDCVCPTQPYDCGLPKCYHGGNIIIPGNQPSISVIKEANPEYIIISGEQVTYTYRVSNTGNTDLHNVVLTDDKDLTPARILPDIVGDEDDLLEKVKFGAIQQLLALRRTLPTLQL